jgi:hypothetical protein
LARRSRKAPILEIDTTEPSRSLRDITSAEWDELARFASALRAELERRHTFDVLVADIERASGDDETIATLVASVRAAIRRGDSGRAAADALLVGLLVAEREQRAAQAKSQQRGRPGGLERGQKIRDGSLALRRRIVAAVEWYAGSEEAQAVYPNAVACASATLHRSPKTIRRHLDAIRGGAQGQ